MPQSFQLQRVLATTDLSARSDRALRRAALLSRAAGAHLMVLHAVDDDQPASLARLSREEATRLMQNQAGGMPELANARMMPIIELGDPFEVILHVAEARGADLIVMGEHRRRPIRDWFAGTTVERVIRRGRRPVLMVHQPPGGPYRRVVMATDFSPHAARALQAALALGLLDDAELTLLHAHEGPGMRGVGLAHLPRPQAEALIAAEMATARTRLEAFAASFELPRAPELLAEEGRAGAVIQLVVERLKPDLVVLGTAGAGLVRHALIGSVAAEVLGSITCDVLAVPPGMTD